MYEMPGYCTISVCVFWNATTKGLGLLVNSLTRDRHPPPYRLIYSGKRSKRILAYGEVSPHSYITATDPSRSASTVE